MGFVDKFLDKQIGIDDPGLRQIAIVAGGALAGAGIGSLATGGTLTSGAGMVASGTAGATTTAAVLGGAFVGSQIATKLSTPNPQLPSLPTTQSITPTSQVQREASTALADLRMRLRQAGSRGKSNMGIEQLKPLPSLMGPRLGAKLG